MVTRASNLNKGETHAKVKQIHSTWYGWGWGPITSLHLPPSSDKWKNRTKGFPSSTKAYRMSLGEPLSPSSACTFKITSPGFISGSKTVVGGDRVKMGGVSCTSNTETSNGQLAMFLVSFSTSVHGSWRNIITELIEKNTGSWWNIFKANNSNTALDFVSQFSLLSRHVFCFNNIFNIVNI